MRSRPVHLLRLRSVPVRPMVFARPALQMALFSTSNSRLQDAPQSPFRVFVNVLKEELQKNKDLQENVKTLQGDVDKFSDSEAMKRTREMYEKARIKASIENNPKLRKAAEDVKKAGLKISDGITEAVKQFEESVVMKNIARASSAVAQAAATATAPVRNTATYKAFAESIEEAFEDKYGAYEDKEARRLRREKRLEKAGRLGGIGKEGVRRRVKENPDAGEALVLSSTPASEPRMSFLQNSETYQRLKETYEDSENPFISSIRSMQHTIGSWFDENETAKVVRKMRELDPEWNMEGWQRELREYIVPEIVDAYLGADREALKLWCGEATYNVLWATMGQYIKQGLISDSKVLDIRHVDVTSGKLLEDETPVFVVSFSTQEVLLFRNAKSGAVVVGAEDQVEKCFYAAVFTRVEDEIENEITGGWKVMEMARRGGGGR